MKRPDVVRVSNSYRADIHMESLSGNRPDYDDGCYVVIPVRNEQEGWALVDRLTRSAPASGAES